MNLTWEIKNWCTKLNREVDYTLVREIKPDCIQEKNGCGNCEYCKSKQTWELS